jgi:hypothetical protein
VQQLAAQPLDAVEDGLNPGRVAVHPLILGLVPGHEQGVQLGVVAGHHEIRPGGGKHAAVPLPERSSSVSVDLAQPG